MITSLIAFSMTRFRDEYLIPQCLFRQMAITYSDIMRVLTFRVHICYGDQSAWWKSSCFRYNHFLRIKSNSGHSGTV